MNYELLFSRKTSFVRAGGRHFRYSVYSVIKAGNKLSLGFGKSKTYSDAISKSSLPNTPMKIEIISKKDTIPFTVTVKVCKTTLKLIPCYLKKGIVANTIIRIILMGTNIKNLYSKILGSKNRINVIKATFAALSIFNKCQELKKD
ncbi:hypothetical protein JSR06_00735 [Candidatus Vidania fulgoroideae]|uniref:Small ribosomal subunit protein uS5 C-terminal domain-containing protein n=1 Tax=Candidatus Vidania fulgoroideorum TaxID=881286 RepID=A0A975ADU3_9PROT|nr:hypothetical protein JSR06_00735 [Candidatus Vidania fulgoroideae]